nr:MAG TPA: hypothetical protein [Caudoviricetes sp.]
MLLKFGKRENVTFSPLVGNLRRNEKAITQNCAKGCAGRYAQNSAHLRSALKIQF